MEAAVQPLAAYLTNHPNKMNKKCQALLEKKDEFIKFSCRFPYMDTPILVDQQRPISLKLCKHWIPSSGLPGAMDNRDWVERTCDISTTWYLMSRVFPMIWETWAIPKTQKMVLDAALLNTQHYKVRIKGKVEQCKEWSSALPYTSV